MATSVSSVTNHFPSAQDGFTTTTSGTTLSGATTVVLNSVTGYTNGQTVVLIIEPTSLTAKQAFTGVVDTAGVQITNVVWTSGTNQTHAAGVTVVDYETATHWSMVTKGLLVEHEQSGLHSTALITSRTEDTAPDLDSDFLLSYDTSAASLKKVKPSSLFGAGWSSLEATPTGGVTNNGNRSYDLTFNSTDLTDTVSEGMRLRLTRTVSAPTQCTDLELSSSQYWVKTTPTALGLTTTATISAWVKLESYAAGTIINTRNASVAYTALKVLSTGQLEFSATAASATPDTLTTYQSIPLGKWVHVAVSMTINSGGNTYIDGVDVPATYSNGTTTAFGNTGDLAIGRRADSAADYFDGKITQVSVYTSILSASTIRSYMSQTLSGAESTCVGLWTFNGNGDDSNASNNDLTASGGALATNVDSPFGSYLGGTLEYGIITKTAFSTNTTLTVQVPEGCAIPTSGGVSAVAYSTQSVPYKFPRDSGRWEVSMLLLTLVSTSGGVAGTIYNPGGLYIDSPIGAFNLSSNLQYQSTPTAGITDTSIGLSTSSSAFTDPELAVRHYETTAVTIDGKVINKPISNTTATKYYLLMLPTTATTTLRFRGSTTVATDPSHTKVTLVPAYL